MKREIKKITVVPKVSGYTGLPCYMALQAESLDLSWENPPIGTEGRDEAILTIKTDLGTVSFCFRSPSARDEIEEKLISKVFV